MIRVCPNCSNNLEDYESHFCHSCGQKLDESIVRIESFFIVNRKAFHPKQVNRERIHIDKKTLLVGVMVISILGGTVIGFMVLRTVVKNIGKKTQVAQIQEKKVVETVNTLNAGFEYTQDSFGVDNILVYIPENVDFYLEGFSLEALLKERIKLEESVVLEVINYTSDHFAVFGRYNEDSWKITLVLLVTDIVEFEKLILEYQSEEWSFHKVGEVYILTSTPEVVSEIENSSRGIAKNITHNPKYSSYKNILPKEGQYVFMNFSDNDEKVFNMVKSYQLDDSLNTLLGEVERLEYNKFVVKKYE